MAHAPDDSAGLYFILLTTVLSFLTGIVIFFVRRYITTNDEHHKGVEKTLGELKDDLDDHKKKMNDGILQMGKHVVEMKSSAAGIREDAAKFQSDMNSELLKVQRATNDVVSDMSTIKKDVKEIHGVVEAHQKSLSLGAQAMVKLRQEFADIKTKVTQIAPDVALYGQEKKKKDPSDKA